MRFQVQSLQNLLKNRGLTLRAAGSKCGLSHVEFIHLIAGRRRPTLATARKIADGLRLTSDERIAVSKAWIAEIQAEVTQWQEWCHDDLRSDE